MENVKVLPVIIYVGKLTARLSIRTNEEIKSVQITAAPSFHFKGSVQGENILFIISFYEIVHRRTIVHNKIISIICSCLFFIRLIFIGLV